MEKLPSMKHEMDIILKKYPGRGTNTMQYCTKHNTVCKLPSCKYGEAIKGVNFEAEDHELSLTEMNNEQEAQFWKEGIRFFKPLNPHWKVTTTKNVYEGTGHLGAIIEECYDFVEK